MDVGRSGGLLGEKYVEKLRLISISVEDVSFAVWPYDLWASSDASVRSKVGKVVMFL